jgi:hypothetical protein
MQKVNIKVFELSNEPDSSGDIIGPDCNITFHQDVFLIKDFHNIPKNVIGKATLYKEDNSFYIKDIALIHYTEEMLKLLTPAICGKMIEREGNKLTKITIDSVGLVLSGNANPDIKSIGEQMRDKYINFFV